MNNIEEIFKKMDSDKEILGIMPKNNKKNIDIYLEKNKNLIKDYKDLEGYIIKEIKRRYSKYSNEKVIDKSSKIQRELTLIENKLNLLDETKTSYEKMGLDRTLINLTYYYKNDFKIINESISYSLKKFNEVGIRLIVEDFSYSNYAQEYIKTFFEEMRAKKRVDSVALKNKFEEIYWKCPELITHISLNFKHLYLKFEKDIDRYYDKKKQEILKMISKENLIQRHDELKNMLIISEKDNKSLLINNILEGKINAKDYKPSAIKKEYSKYVSSKKIENISTKLLNELDLNLIKLLNNLYEYREYYNFKYVIDNVKTIYSEKEKYKNAYKDTKNEIIKLEKKLKKINKKSNSRFFGKKKENNYINEQNALILELKDKYKELSNNKFYNKIAVELTDKSTLRDILMFSNSFYKYVILCMKENDIPETEYKENVKKLNEFINWPNCTILTNVTILDEKDISLIIRDRYKLANIEVSEENLDVDNISSTIADLEKIVLNYYLRKNKIDIDELIYMCEYKKILGK